MALEKDGDTCEVQGSGAKPYVLKYIGGVYSCSCPAWRNQSEPIDKRTCKHLKKVRGEIVEIARVAGVALSPENLALDAALKSANRAVARDAAPAPKQAAKPVKSAVPSFGSPSGRSPTKPPTQNIPIRPVAKSTIDDLLGRRKTSVAKTSEDFAAGVRAVEMDEDEEEPEAVGIRAVDMDDEGDEKPPTQFFNQNNVIVTMNGQDIINRAAAQGRKLRPDEKAKLNGPPVLLALPFEESDIDPKGWWMSEKLDGVRAYWNGEKFISRQGNVFYAPAWFTKNLPDHPLDGELWMGRRMFQKTISVVKSIDAGERWRNVKYLTFDLPHLRNEGFEKRMEKLVKLCSNSFPDWVSMVEQTSCLGLDHLKKELSRLVALGAEGIMLRQPNSIYIPARSDTLLKVKPWKDAEAVVLSYEPGQGRHLGRLGSLVVRARMQTDNVTRWVDFKLGTGLTDADRRNPPPIGSTVTFRYMDLTDDGVPKGASFIAVRDYE
jgi:DNA ligase-1